MYKIIAQILLFLFVTSILIAFFAHFQINIFVNIALSIFLQYAGFTAYKNIIEITLYKKIQQAEITKLRELSYQAVEVICPCSKDAKQIVPIRLNTPNQYKCNKCNKNVAIYIAVETAFTTEPIPSVNTSAIDNLLLSKLNESTV